MSEKTKVMLVNPAEKPKKKRRRKKKANPVEATPKRRKRRNPTGKYKEPRKLAVRGQASATAGGAVAGLACELIDSMVPASKNDAGQVEKRGWGGELVAWGLTAVARVMQVGGSSPVVRNMLAGAAGAAADRTVTRYRKYTADRDGKATTAGVMLNRPAMGEDVAPNALALAPRRLVRSRSAARAAVDGRYARMVGADPSVMPAALISGRPSTASYDVTPHALVESVDFSRTYDVAPGCPNPWAI